MSKGLLAPGIAPFYGPHRMDPSRLPISVCILSGNEENRIGQALAGASPWAGEIIVMLNHDVSDRTEEIARSHGATVYREKWRGYVEQHNLIAEKASLPWIFCLASDEAVTPEWIAEVKSVFADSARLEKACGFNFPRTVHYLGRWIRHGDWYPDRGTRIWRRGKARWIGLNPHNFLEVDGPEVELKSDILHYSHRDLNHHLEKIQSYSDLFVKQRVDRGKTFRASEMVFRPVWRFLRGYVFKLGFLDGWAGFCGAGMNAIEAFVRYSKLLEHQVNQNSNSRKSCPKITGS